MQVLLLISPQLREVRHKRSANWSWLWHCGSRKGRHSFWTLTLSTCHWIRDRASAGSSTCRPTNWLQLLPPLTTAVGEKWGGVLVIIHTVLKMGRADTWRGLDNLSIYSLFLTLIKSRVGKHYLGTWKSISPQIVYWQNIQYSECLWSMYVGCYLRVLEYINSFHLQSNYELDNNYRWEGWGTERQSNLPSIIHLASGRD